MPVIENRSNTRDEIVLIVNPVSDTVIRNSAIIDVSNYPLGVTFVPIAVNLQSNEIYTFSITESSASNMSGETVIEDARLTAPISELTRQNNNDLDGDFLNGIGVFNTLQFIRIIGQATVEGLSGRIFVYVRQGIDSKPVRNITS